MRHDLGRSLRVTGDPVPVEFDARRKREPVVLQHRAIGKRNASRRRIDGYGLSLHDFDPGAAKPSYENVMLFMSRMPPITALLNGHDTNWLSRSTRTTWIRGSTRRNSRAMLAPPKPPPITTTFGAACAAAPRRKTVPAKSLPPRQGQFVLSA